VLDELDTFFEGGDLDLSLVVFISPLGVFSFSFSGSLLDGLNGLIVILVGLSKTSFSVREDFGVVNNGLFEGSDGSYFLNDLRVEPTDVLVTSSLVGLVVGISFTLILLEGSGDLVEEEDDFFLRVSGSQVQSNGGDESLSEMILINLGQDGLGVSEVLSLDGGSSENAGHQHSADDKLVHLCVR